MTNGDWIRFRFVPAMLVAAVAGALLGALRGSLGFSLFGIQGMVAGGLVGYATGWLGRNDPGRHWIFTQRVWLALAAAVAFVVPHLAVTSFVHAGPIDPPLYWLGEVVDGSLKEPFLAIKRGGSAAGEVEGGWWVAFTLVDTALLAFAHLAGTVMALSGTAALEPDASAPDSIGPVRSARHAALWLVVLVAAGAVAYAVAPWEPRPNPYSTDNIARITRLAGEWRILDGQGIFADTEGERRFTLRVVGFNTLVGTSAEPGAYEISVDNEGENFRGQLRHSRHEGFAGLPTYFRMRPSANDAQILMVFERYGSGGRRDVTVAAARVER